jgi:hypothetical protein
MKERMNQGENRKTTDRRVTLDPLRIESTDATTSFKFCPLNCVDFVFVSNACFHQSKATMSNDDVVKRMLAEAHALHLAQVVT